MKKKVRPRSSQSEYVAHSRELTRGRKLSHSTTLTELEEVTTIEEGTQTEEVTVAEEVTQTEAMAQIEEMVQTEEMETPVLNVTVTHSEHHSGLHRSGWGLWVWHGFLAMSVGDDFWPGAGVRTSFRVASVFCPWTFSRSSILEA